MEGIYRISKSEAIQMYNLICDVEQDISDGVNIENLNIDLLAKTKEHCLDIIYDEPTA